MPISPPLPIMNLHDLAPRPGAKKSKKRLGCGESSGHGKTSGKGHKGQKARTGRNVRPGFEGGQMPIYRRLPRRGFSTAQFRDAVAVVNITDLDKHFEAGDTVSIETLAAKGLLNHRFDKVKLLGQGETTKALTVSVHAASASAQEKLQAAGGSFAALTAAAEVA